MNFKEIPYHTVTLLIFCGTVCQQKQFKSVRSWAVNTVLTYKE